VWLLIDTSTNNSGVAGGSTRLRSNSLNGLHNSERVAIIVDLSEYYVLPIEPASDDGGDEELRSIGVRTSIGHGEEEWAVVLQLEVLILELLTVNALSASTIVTSEIASLKHEVGNHTMEGGALVATNLVTFAELRKVLGSIRNDIVIEGEVDTAGLCLPCTFTGDLASVVDLNDWALPLAIEIALGARHVGSARKLSCRLGLRG